MASRFSVFLMLISTEHEIHPIQMHITLLFYQGSRFCSFFTLNSTEHETYPIQRHITLKFYQGSRFFSFLMLSSTEPVTHPFKVNFTRPLGFAAFKSLTQLSMKHILFNCTLHVGFKKPLGMQLITAQLN